MRSLMYLLSLELFGRPLTLPEFPIDRSITGLGLSDWEGYSSTLGRCFEYTNTFYHREPRLDITVADPALRGRYTFIVASDVFEHIPIKGLCTAFDNLYRMLRPAGFLIYTVPFAKKGQTVEHFPRLNSYSIEDTEEGRILRNVTDDGKEEIYRDLVFHGGDGSTLEMRHFSESGLRREFDATGFASIEVRDEHYPMFGILWPMDWAVPMIARKSLLASGSLRRLTHRIRKLSARRVGRSSTARSI